MFKGIVAQKYRVIYYQTHFDSREAIYFAERSQLVHFSFNLYI